MLIEILKHTPAWVWLLLSALLALGVVQMRPRSVRRWQPALLPLALLALGLSSLLPSWQQVPWSLPVWAAALLLAARAGRRWLAPSGVHWDATLQRLHLPGSTLPLLMVAIIFPLKYSVGVYSAMHPLQAHAPGFVTGVALLSGLLTGLLTGLLAGRTWALLSMARAAAGSTMPAHALRTGS